MAEQQLIDYIKKARQAGQADEQTKSLLAKNGWSEPEIADAFVAINQAPASISQMPEPVLQPRPEPEFKPQPQPQTQPEPAIQQPAYQPQPSLQTEPKQYQVSGQAEIKKPFQSQEPAMPSQSIKEQVAQQRRQPEPEDEYEKPKSSAGGLILKIFLVLFVLALLGAAGYFAWKTNIVSDIYQAFFAKQDQAITPQQNTQQQNSSPAQTPAPIIESKVVAQIAQEYDVSKITVAAFSQAGDKVAYCATLKVNAYSVACFVNDQKLSNNYTYKPYWIGISPDGKRVVFLYYDSVKKQSFVFEDGKEGVRYSGSITAPAFSSDSKSFMFMVVGYDTKNYIVVNDKPFPAHEKIFTVPEFSKDGKFVFYGARDGQNISWIADPIQTQTPAPTQAPTGTEEQK